MCLQYEYAHEETAEFWSLGSDRSRCLVVSDWRVLVEFHNAGATALRRQADHEIFSQLGFPEDSAARASNRGTARCDSCDSALAPSEFPAAEDRSRCGPLDLSRHSKRRFILEAA